MLNHADANELQELLNILDSSIQHFKNENCSEIVINVLQKELDTQLSIAINEGYFLYHDACNYIRDGHKVRKVIWHSDAYYYYSQSHCIVDGYGRFVTGDFLSYISDCKYTLWERM